MPRAPLDEVATRMERRSALIDPIGPSRKQAAIREHGDRTAALGMPTDMTILFASIPVRYLDRSLRSAIGGVVRGSHPNVLFDQVARVSGMA